MRQLPLTLARILALGVMAMTPWLYGGTLPWTIELISQCLLGVTALAVIGWLVAWQPPRVGWVIPVSLGLLALGWLSALYPRSRYDEMLKLLFPLEDAPSLGSWFTGTVDQDRSLPAMLRLSGLIGLLWIARDMAAETRWRKVIVWVLVATGVSVAIHGIIQRNVGDLWGYWDVKKLTRYVFAGFWYHANAAAFLNLIWPFAAALCLESFARRWNQILRALLILALVVLIIASLVNVSKAGHVVLGSLVILFTCLIVPVFLRTITGHEKVQKISFFILTGLIVTGIALGLYFGTGTTEKRWEELNWERIAGGDLRFTSARYCLSEIPRAGWQGFGPGTYEAVFLDAGTIAPDIEPKGRWRYAHQDTLQTLVEWGWLGGSGWIALGLGLLIQSYIRLGKLYQSQFSSRYTVQAAAVTALTGVALHAQADFPLQILGVQVVVAVVAGLGSQREKHKHHRHEAGGSGEERSSSRRYRSKA